MSKLVTYRGYSFVAASGFVSEWKTDNTSSGSSASDQVSLPLVSDGTYNFTVDWGDGNQDVITTYNQSEVTHTYSSSGTYTITITGTIVGWEFSNTGDRLKILQIASWGSLTHNFRRAFWGCSNLVITATDTFTLTNSNAIETFRENSSITQVGLIDVSVCDNFTSFYRGCSNLDQDLTFMDLSNGSNFTLFLDGVTLSTANYDALLIHLESTNQNNSLSFHGGSSTYTLGGAAEAARTALINDHSWTITDGGGV